MDCNPPTTATRRWSTPLRPFGLAAGHLARPLAQFRRRHAAPLKQAICRKALTSASPISTLPTITARRAALPRRLRRHTAHRFRRLPRRADRLDQGRIRYVARSLRRMGQPQYVLASLDQSLKRWASTMSISSIRTATTPTRRRGDDGALIAVRAGKALYVGISSYNCSARAKPPICVRSARLHHHQPSYSMINRWVEDDGLLDTLDGLGVGSIVFCRWRRAC